MLQCSFVSNSQYINYKHVRHMEIIRVGTELLSDSRIQVKMQWRQKGTFIKLKTHKL